MVLHLSLLFSWPRAIDLQRGNELVPVSLLPLIEKSAPETPSKDVETPRTRPAKAPALLARKSTFIPEETGKVASGPAEKERGREESHEIEIKDRPQEKIVVHRPLPTLRELLPPVTSSAPGHPTNSDGPIRLDTREPKYISYFDSIKRAIEIEWQYPEPALRQGLQGILVLEFTVLGNGSLERTRMLRSSGFSVLDEEALRAVRAASPFHAIPPWIGRARLDIIASFEYHDNRVKYGSVP